MEQEAPQQLAAFLMGEPYLICIKILHYALVLALMKTVHFCIMRGHFISVDLGVTCGIIWHTYCIHLSVSWLPYFILFLPKYKSSRTFVVVGRERVVSEPI